MPTAYLLYNFNVARVDRATLASTPSDLAVLRHYIKTVTPSAGSGQALSEKSL